MAKRIKKIKQKQKQKQSQNVIVTIDQSKKIMQRKPKEQADHRPRLAPIIHLPSYPQQQQAPMYSQPPSRPTATAISSPPIETPTPIATPTATEPSIAVETAPIPRHFIGKLQTVGRSMTSPSSSSPFQQPQDNSLSAILLPSRRQALPIPDFSEANIEEQEDVTVDELPAMEVPSENKKMTWKQKFYRAFSNLNISEEDRATFERINDNIQSKGKTSYSNKERNLINTYLDF